MQPTPHSSRYHAVPIWGSDELYTSGFAMVENVVAQGWQKRLRISGGEVSRCITSPQTRRSGGEQVISDKKWPQ
jgi:hypothetical protein